MAWLTAVLLGLVLLAAASILVVALKTGIGPVPTFPKAMRAMVAAVEAAAPGPVIDLGSGWGTLAIACARRFPQRRVVGYELSWVPWAVASLAGQALRLHNLSFRREDFLKADLSAAGVVLTCYLFRQGMQRLADKLAREGPPAMLVSNTFALPSSQPEEVTQLDDLYRTRIYVYRWRR